MESTFGLEIYAANRQFFAGRAKSLIIPAEDGQKEFLENMFRLKKQSVDSR